jgi:hypothetical protein
MAERLELETAPNFAEFLNNRFKERDLTKKLTDFETVLPPVLNESKGVPKAKWEIFLDEKRIGLYEFERVEGSQILRLTYLGKIPGYDHNKLFFLAYGPKIDNNFEGEIKHNPKYQIPFP